MESPLKFYHRKIRQVPCMTKLDKIIETLRRNFHFKIKIFPLEKIPDAITWAERGFISIHENYLSRRKKSYHIISTDKARLLRLCRELSIPEDSIRSSDFYKFWHTNWIPENEGCKARK
ncbi:MAG: hypothetical protein D4R73_10725 [Deltaproteobacteria bacterium]|nr:MAG: hypothetical protein D4R73_10725 [Deltaproteobacteria bacterium]